MCRKGFSCGQSTVAVGVAFKTKAELDAFMAAVRSGEAEIRDWRVRVHDNPKLLKMYVTDILEKSGQTAALHVHMPGMFHAEVVALMEAKGDGPHITVFVSRDICDVCRLKDLPKNLPAASDGGSVTFIDRVGSGETTEEKFMRMYKITRKDPTKPRIVLADVLAAPKAVPFPGCVLGGLCPDLCQAPECPHYAAWGSDKCVGHGGGARCQEEGCDKGKVGGYVHCRNHGGGNGCTGCDKKGDKCAMSRKIVPTSTVECKKCADMSSGRSKRKSQTIGGKKTKATKTT